MSERQERIRWLRGQIEAMLRNGDDVECLRWAGELAQLEEEEAQDE